MRYNVVEVEKGRAVPAAQEVGSSMKPNTTEYKRAYNEKAYDRISVTVPKGRKQAIEAHAGKDGESVNGLINKLLRENMGLSADEWKGGDTSL